MYIANDLFKNKIQTYTRFTVKNRRSVDFNASWELFKLNENAILKLHRITYETEMKFNLNWP